MEQLLLSLFLLCVSLVAMCQAAHSQPHHPTHDKIYAPPHREAVRQVTDQTND